MPPNNVSGTYLYQLLDLEAEDVRLRTRMFSISHRATVSLRRWGGERITNIIGQFTSGKTLLMEALIRYLRTQGHNVGCLPETTVGDLRPWEKQGEYVERVSRCEFESRYKDQDFLVAYERKRGRSGVIKTGGISSRILKDRANLSYGLTERIPKYDYLLMTVNAVAQMELREVFIPPIPAIVVVVTSPDHALMQSFRNAHPLDSAGLSTLGVQAKFEKVPGVLWWRNQLFPGVAHLDESDRREKVIQLLMERFESPLTEFEHGLFPLEVVMAHRPKTLGEYLKQIIVRGQDHD